MFDQTSIVRSCGYYEDAAFSETSRPAMPLTPLAELDISYASNVQEAIHLRDQGYEPVECSFGSESIVGAYCLDHHGQYSAEEPVSVRAVHIAANPDFPGIKRFVVTGLADPDAVYTILTLSRVIAPSLEIGSAIGQLDLDPIGISRFQGDYLRNPAFEMNSIPTLDKDGFLRALEVGAAVFSPQKLADDASFKALRWEVGRIKRAHSAVLTGLRANKTMLVISDEPGRDIWHQHAPLVVQFKPNMRVLTISGCPVEGGNRVGQTNVFSLLGDRGLEEIRPCLLTVFGNGSGGRPDIIGSPRGRAVTLDEAKKVFYLVDRLAA